MYQLLPKEVWYGIKQDIYSREGHQCYVCRSKEGQLSAHEFWEYDDEKHVQRLVGIHHLCNLCHKIKHIGFWCHTIEGKSKLKQEGLDREDLIKHFCSVNDCTREDFLKHEQKAFDLWQERSMHRWKQEFGQYTKYLEYSM